MKVRALKANIFKPSFGDFSNGGISSQFDEVFIECPDGPIEFDINCLPKNFVRPIYRLSHSKESGYYSARPAFPVSKGCVGWMFGGCLIYSSDSRFPSDYPLPLHDRQETQREYELNSM